MFPPSFVSLWDKAPQEPPAAGVAGRGCAAHGGCAAAEPPPPRSRAGSGGERGAPARRLRAAARGPGAGRARGPGVQGRGGAGGGRQRGWSVESRCFPSKRGLQRPMEREGCGRSVARWGSRAQAERGIFPAVGFSAIFASKTFPGALRRRLERWSIFKRRA